MPQRRQTMSLLRSAQSPGCRDTKASSVRRTSMGRLRIICGSRDISMRNCAKRSASSSRSSRCFGSASMYSMGHAPVGEFTVRSTPLSFTVSLPFTSETSPQ
jgi:hypothetical protein